VTYIVIALLPGGGDDSGLCVEHHPRRERDAVANHWDRSQEQEGIEAEVVFVGRTKKENPGVTSPACARKAPERRLRSARRRATRRKCAQREETEEDQR